MSASAMKTKSRSLEAIKQQIVDNVWAVHRGEQRPNMKLSRGHGVYVNIENKPKLAQLLWEMIRSKDLFFGSRPNDAWLEVFPVPEEPTPLNQLTPEELAAAMVERAQELQRLMARGSAGAKLQYAKEFPQLLENEVPTSDNVIRKLRQAVSEANAASADVRSRVPDRENTNMAKTRGATTAEQVDDSFLDGAVKPKRTRPAKVTKVTKVEVERPHFVETESAMDDLDLAIEGEEAQGIPEDPEATPVKAPRARKAPKQPKLAVAVENVGEGFCRSGSGREVAPGKAFSQGGDARYKGLLQRVIKGVATPEEKAIALHPETLAHPTIINSKFMQDLIKAAVVAAIEKR